VITYLHFFGPECPDGFLDARYRSPITYRGIAFGSAAHLLAYIEARFFGDITAEGRIRLATSPKAVQAAASTIRRDPLLDREWSRHRFREIAYVQKLKFQQHSELARLLGATGEALLCYADPSDRIMSIGIADTHPNACRPDRWQGLNLLGQALSLVRGRAPAVAETRSADPRSAASGGERKRVLPPSAGLPESDAFCKNARVDAVHRRVGSCV
jgi:hypothetical protein